MLSVLLPSCGNTTSPLVISQDAYEKEVSIRIPESEEEKAKCKNATLTDEKVVSAQIEIKSSIYDDKGRGVLFSERFENLQSLSRVSSTFSIEASTHNGAKKSLTGSALYADGEGLEATLESQKHFVAQKDIPTSMCVEPGWAMDIANRYGGGVFPDNVGETRVGFGKNESLVVEVKYLWGGTLKTGTEERSTSLSYYEYSKRQDGSFAHTKKVEYYDYKRKRSDGGFFAQSLVVRNYGYVHQALPEVDLDETLPSLSQPYCYSLPRTRYEFAPLLDLTDFFSDGKTCLMISPYEAGKYSNHNIGFTEVGGIVGQSESAFGDRAFFAYRLPYLK